MRPLVPQFILDQLAHNRHFGAHTAVAMMVDVSGFTQLTESMMAVGRNGAEILADTLRTIFAPLILSVYQHDGYIAGFAGDAFVALFPGSDRIRHLRALSAAWSVRERLAPHQTIATEFGEFHFGIKISMASGDLEWQIWQSENATGLSQSAAFAIIGPAIDRAMAADEFTEPGEIVFDQSVIQVLSDELDLQPLGTPDSTRLVAKLVSSEIQLLPPSAIAETPANGAVTQFYPESILTSNLTGEFRPVVTLFLGISTLPEPGEPSDLISGVLRLLNQYGGHLCRIDRNHGTNRLLFFWGAPVSRENDIERALSFILDFRQRAPLPIKAGLTYQIGYAGFVGSELRQEYTCYGSHVNLAARLLASAGWGDIWIDEEIARRVTRSYAIESLGMMRFKGFDKEQPVFRVSGFRTEPAQPFFQGELIGRKREVTELSENLQPIFAGQYAGVILVTGEAGIGKSRVIYEVLSALQRNGREFEWVRGQADEILRQSLNPLRYHLRTYFGLISTATVEKNKANFNSKLDELIAELPSAQLSLELDRTRPALGALVDLHWEDSFYSSLSPLLKYENTLIALKTFFLARSLLQPVVIVIEDAQWLDDDTIQFIERLSRNVDRYPIAVLISSRYATIFHKSVQKDLVRLEFQLKPLNISGIKALVNDRLRIDIANQLMVQLMERSQGNPLFLEQMVFYLEENNLLSNGQTNIPLPDDARAALVARLDGLSSEIRHVVQTAAVLGREFELPILTYILLDDHEIPHKIRVATEEAIWYSINEWRYLFRHNMLREAAYGMQLGARLRQIHHRAALAMEELYAENINPHLSEIGYHYEQAGEINNAIQYWQQAGDIAKGSYQNREALDNYGRMLKYLTADGQKSDRLQILQKLAEVFQFVDMYDDALNTLQEAAAIALDLRLSLEVGRAKVNIGSILILKGDFDQAKQVLDESIELLKDVNAHRELGVAYREMGNVWEGLGSYSRAAECFQQSLSSFESAGDSEGKARTLIGLGIVAWNEGAFELAEELYKQSRRIFEENNDLYNAAIAVTNLANVSLVRNDWATAKEYYENSLQVFRKCGNLMSQAIILGNLGNLNYNMEDYPQSEQHNLESYRINLEIGSLEGAAYNLINLGKLSIVLGQLKQARTRIRKALELALQIGSPRLMLEVLLPASAFLQSKKSYARALLLTSVVKQHPASHAYLQEVIAPVEEVVAKQLSAEEIQKIRKQGRNYPLHEIIVNLLAEDI